MHDLGLLPTVAAAFGAAWVFGLITQKLGLSPIVGYLLAGISIGPHTPGFIGDPEVAEQLAKIGVILLMFGVGLHFRLGDLLSVRGIAVPGAVGQSAVATALTALVVVFMGWSLRSGLVLGMALAVASTVVLMRMLDDRRMLHTTQGRVAVGWLVVEDIFTVLLLVLLPMMAEARGAIAGGDLLDALLALGWAMLKLSALVAIVLLAGSRVVPWILVQVARLRSRELFTLTVLVIAISIAVGSASIFDSSIELGAFLAGMVVGRSPTSHQAAADALPLRDAFAVLFFVSIGMLLDPTFLAREPMLVGLALAIVLVAKPLTALMIVLWFGHSLRTALTVAVGLAQIGEFSFILGTVAVETGSLPSAGMNVLVATAIVSIAVNPIAFKSIEG
ncbi:MAG: sodium:proton exchanger, partial [Phycisphaerae bacterium]|nr:sodium:proton exchanger [Phycisphaerae bacterium]